MINTPTYVTSAAILSTLAIIFGIIFSILLYIVFSYSLFIMVKKRNMPNPWMAWIPIVNFYCIGKMVGPISIFKLNLTNTEIILPLAFCLFIGLAYIPLVGFILSAAGLLVIVMAMNKLYQQFDPENSFVLTILTAILPVLAAPVIMFIYRNK